MYTLIIALHLNGNVYVGENMESLLPFDNPPSKDFTEYPNSFTRILILNHLNNFYSSKHFCNHEWRKSSKSSVPSPSDIKVLRIVYKCFNFYVQYEGYNNEMYEMFLEDLLLHYFYLLCHIN